MIEDLVMWCRKEQKIFESEGKPYRAKLFGLLAAYYERFDK